MMEYIYCDQNVLLFSFSYNRRINKIYGTMHQDTFADPFNERVLCRVHFNALYTIHSEVSNTYERLDEKY